MVNPPGVDLPERIPSRVPVAGRPVKVLFVGGDFARKGGFLLVEALQTLDVPWELHLVTRDETPGAPNIRVHGALENRSETYAALFRSCDLFALPTLADCHSIATIEAMAAGLPVISTNVGGIPEIVVDGQTGFLTAPGDREALRRSLCRLIADPALRQRMGEAGRRRAEARFDARDRASTVRAVIESVASRRATSDQALLARANAASTRC
jgi:glycosyltransferase involved in cell wall biosynthesis